MKKTKIVKDGNHYLIKYKCWWWPFWFTTSRYIGGMSTGTPCFVKAYYDNEEIAKKALEFMIKAKLI